MRCKHSWVNYFWRGVIIFFALIAGLFGDNGDPATNVLAVIVALVLAATIVIDQLTNYLEVDQNFVKGRTGLIKRQDLSSPVNRLNYCEYKTFLIWNSVKIGTGSSVFRFKNVSHGREFVDTVNNYIVQK